MEAYFVYVTTKDGDEARAIAKAVVEERLAACANILGGIQSVYRWEGKLCEDSEVALVLKTSHPRKAQLIDRVKQLHSYEVPCILCLPIADGNPGFIRWIEGQTD
ncbi:Divalent-cation tolerance protein CutA [Pontiella desulfatans]|uniref:Divalent-cation tolerance protein CutA n=1 Tax=Pontiella desulfatans TaxID=2750659 RepID=A0A6C2U679_PONDE|nr:divalent-cation tolerance protein CutA [Pontiella desulfatans]VGO15349.1 Divalent-cation tolerance protein CutA [Pontiella desulfatans]